MTNPTHRFTNRVETYIKYRPGYPAEVIELLRSDCGLTKEAVVADIGSGTGIFSELLLRNGNAVFGIEPNEAMRTAGEQLLAGFQNFTSVKGSAEATTLQTASVDLITAGQAFHWFDGPEARAEFVRILKPNGFVVLIWNDRRLDSTPFLRGFEELLLTFGTDYAKVRELTDTSEIAKFFAPGKFTFKTFPNIQDFDLDGLKGRVFSASYTPEPGHPNFEPMLKRLAELFGTHEKAGKVAFEYDTKVYYGALDRERENGGIGE